MVDRQVHGWIRARDERTGSWARLPRPAGALWDPVPDPFATGHRGSTPFPQPSAGRPVFLRSASRAPGTPGSPGDVRPRQQPWHQVTPGPRAQPSAPRHQPTPDPRLQPSAPRHQPTPDPGSRATPGHQPTPRPAPRPAAPPQVIPLGGDLALVSVGQWDEESATTVQMPAIVDEPEDPADPADGGPAAADRD